MLAQLTTKHLNGLVSAAVVLPLAGLVMAPPAFGRIMVNTIDPVAIVTDHGRHLVVTGPIACTEGQRALLHVTVTQRTTGAVAEGRTRLTCTGNMQQWEVHASIQGQETFQDEPATAVALARTIDRGDSHEAHRGNDCGDSDEAHRGKDFLGRGKDFLGHGDAGKRTTDCRDTDDAHQWLVAITLVRE